MKRLIWAMTMAMMSAAVFAVSHKDFGRLDAAGKLSLAPCELVMQVVRTNEVTEVTRHEDEEAVTNEMDEVEAVMRVTYETNTYTRVVTNWVTRGECRLTAADYAAAGWLAIDRSLPDAPDGKVVTPTGWTDESGTIKRTYTITDAPEPVKVPRKFSKLKIYAAITKLGAWEKIQAWLEAKEVDGVNGWIAFQLAQEVSEDNELFAAWAEEARQLLGLDETTFNAFLDGCILEEN